MKKTPDWLKVSAPAALLSLEGGRALRLLTETEEMQVRREAMELAVNEMDLPLCSNACLVARALVCAGERVYADGRAVLDGLSAEEIEALAERWAAFRREKGVGLGLGEKRLDALKASLAALAGERRDVALCLPGGYHWTPKRGDTVLVVKGGAEGAPCIVGTPAGQKVPAGEVFLSVKNGVGVRLTADGRICLVGPVEIAGSLSVNGKEMEV